MKKTFTIKLDTEFSIDFTSWSLSDAEQEGGCASKRLVIQQYFEQMGVDEFEVSEKTSNSLFEAMAEVVKVQNDYFLAHKNEFENSIERKTR